MPKTVRAARIAFAPSATRERYWLYSLLFALTLVTTCLVGAAMQSDFDRNVPVRSRAQPRSYVGMSGAHPAALLQGLPFSLTLLLILLAHEFGHYLACRLSIAWTPACRIFCRRPISTAPSARSSASGRRSTRKRVLFDIGIAGPLAGFVFLLPALADRLAFSKVMPGIAHEGSHPVSACPCCSGCWSRPSSRACRRGDIYLHPVARAAWVGMFATAMNLLPIGQLDGGHILYSFFPQRHRDRHKMLCIADAVPLGLFWMGVVRSGPSMLFWWLGRRHPAIYDSTRTRRRRARKLGWLALAIFLLCFTYAADRAGGCDTLMKITATIITLNEERNIARAIESLRCCDEILILDSGSTDRTVELAQKLGVARDRGRLARLRRAEELGRRAGRARLDPLARRRRSAERGAGSARSGVSRRAGPQLRRLHHAPPGPLSGPLDPAFGLVSGPQGPPLRPAQGQVGRRVRARERAQSTGRVGHLESNILHFTCDSLSEHLKTLDRYTTLAAQELAAQQGPRALVAA